MITRNGGCRQLRLPSHGLYDCVMAAMQITDPEHCDVCGPNRPQGVGARVAGMCKDCVRDTGQEYAVYSELTYGTDAKGRRRIEQIPDDPDLN